MGGAKGRYQPSEPPFVGLRWKTNQENAQVAPAQDEIIRVKGDATSGIRFLLFLAPTTRGSIVEFWRVCLLNPYCCILQGSAQKLGQNWRLLA